jgi:long-subunit fatty acid transport protein
MVEKLATRFASAIVVAATAAAPSVGAAQEWSVQSGATARAEYNDNYFFTAANQLPPVDQLAPVSQQSAFTGSITPFVTAARRTETSDVTALLAVGANKVWGLSSNVDYASGRFVLDGSLHEGSSTWVGDASFTRSASLQNAVGPTGTTLVLAYTNAALVSGTYSYALTERWSLGANVGAYDNRYASVENVGTLSDNHGYYGRGNVGYAFSDRTQLTFSAAYLHDASDITHSDSVTTTLGVVHQFSPQLTISASVGGFWSDTRATENGLVCPATPIECDTGLVPRVPVTTSDKRRDNGPLYGGSISYAFSERTQLGASLSETLTPSGTGTLSRGDNASAALSHRFSERMTGRLGVSYARTTFPTALQGSSTDKYYQGQVGVSYQLAEHWTLEAGYQYARARYSQNSSEPKSNVVFVSVGYNWPGASFTGWVGTRPDTQGLPGAGPVPLPERSPGGARPQGAAPYSELPEGSPFDRFTIP